MIELRDVRKSFGAVTAVDGLSLQVRRGEVFGLLGPNGAGKTTSVHMAVGLLAPDSGRIVVDGEGSPTDARVRRKIGVAPQALALYEEMSGEENLAFFGALQGLSGRRLAGRFGRLTRRRSGSCGRHQRLGLRLCRRRRYGRGRRLGRSGRGGRRELRRRAPRVREAHDRPRHERDGRETSNVSER